MNSVPVVIIGAPRSGTNVLRDVLTTIPGLGTWPCDEINYIWRHGHVFHPSDEFTPDMATPRLKRYIRRRFEWVARRYKAHTVVEKTCANSLRVGFVNRIVPEAKYIVIRRNGIDAAASAMKRWKASLDIAYLARKARFIPWVDLPYYVLRYIYNRLSKVATVEKQLSFWGPAISDMDRVMSNRTLPEKCILQWKRCVDLADKAFDEFSDDAYLDVSYEVFVRTPSVELERILDFLDVTAPPDVVSQAIAPVSGDSVGKGLKLIPEDQQRKMWELAAETLRRHGYG